MLNMNRLSVAKAMNPEQVRRARWLKLDAIPPPELVGKCPLMGLYSDVLLCVVQFCSLSDLACLFRTSKQTICHLTTKKVLAGIKQLIVPYITMTDFFHSHPFMSLFGCIRSYPINLQIEHIDWGQDSLDEFTYFRRPDQNDQLRINSSDSECLTTAKAICYADTQLSVTMLTVSSHPIAIHMFLDCLDDITLGNLHGLKLFDSSYRGDHASYCTYRDRRPLDFDEDEEHYIHPQPLNYAYAALLYGAIGKCTSLRILEIEHVVDACTDIDNTESLCRHAPEFLCKFTYPKTLQSVSLTNLHITNSELHAFLSSEDTVDLDELSFIDCFSADGGYIKMNDSINEFINKWRSWVQLSTFSDSVCKSLQTLAYVNKGNYAYECDLSKLVNLTSLQYYSIPKNEIMREAVILGDMPKLKHLIIGKPRSNQIYNKPNSRIVLSDLSQSYPNLEGVAISNFVIVVDNMSAFYNLNELALVNCRLVKMSNITNYMRIEEEDQIMITLMSTPKTILLTTSRCNINGYYLPDYHKGLQYAIQKKTASDTSPEIHTKLAEPTEWPPLK